MFLLIGFNFLLAVVYILTKQVAYIATPLFLTGSRFIAAGLFFFLGLDKKEKNSLLYLLNQDYVYFIYICIGWGMGDIFRLYSLQIIPASHASLLATTAPFLALISSYFILGERITCNKVIALFIGVIGLIPLLYKKIASSAQPMGIMASYIYLMISLLALIIAGIYSKKLSSKGYSVSVILAGSLCYVGLGALIMSYILEPWSMAFVQPLLENYKPFISLIFAQNILGFYLYNYLVKIYPVTVVTFANLLIPLFGSLLLWWYGMENLEIEFIFGFFMIAAAFYLLLFFKKK